MPTQRALSGLFARTILAFLALLTCATVQAKAQENDAGPPQPREWRFSVVHAHFGNNCAGYLYVSQESVRYEALVPANYKNHSFQIQRAEITSLQPWVLMGQVQNVAEIKTARATYHFWLLRKEADLNAARSSNLNLVAAPAQALIAAIRNPQSLHRRAASRTSAGDEDARSEAPPGEESGGDAGAASPRARNDASARRGAPPVDAGSRDASADREPEPARALPAGALEGIYIGFGLNGTHMGSRQYYFTPDGWVINNIPFVNMDNFDMAAYRADPSNKLFFGRYRVEGNQIHIVWANNADRRDVISFDERAANPAIDMYIPTCRCTGKTFSGRYHWDSTTDPHYLQFFPDGSFFDHGLTDQIVYPNPHGFAGITDPPRNFRGTYRIRNQKLTFHFADGKQATVAFIAPKALEKAPRFEWFGAGHGSGVRGAETVIVLMLYEEHYQVQP